MSTGDPPPGSEISVIHPPAASRAARGEGPEGSAHPRASPEHAALLDRLVEAGAPLRARSAIEIAAALGAVGRRFLEPGDALRREALERLPGETGHSPAMCEAILDGMARDWTSDRLGRLLASEFADPGVLDGFRSGPEGTRLHAVGGPLAFHVGSGNVPGVATTSVIRSLLVKCPVLLKPGRADRTLPGLFARGLAERDPELGRALAVAYWPRGRGGDLEARLLLEAERVVVYGGIDVVGELRRRLPVTTPLVAYHHRVSFGAVSREHLDTPGRAGQVARDAAKAVAVFDRRGCVSPQLIWVEEGGTVQPSGWAELLARELDRLEGSLPSAELTGEEASERQQLLGAAEMASASGKNVRVLAEAKGRSAVLFGHGDDIPAGGPGRTVHVRPIGSLENLTGELEPFSRVLQTLALSAPDPRREALAHALAGSGLTRITSFPRQPWPPAWWHHDGLGPLRTLVRWIELEPS